MKKFLLFLLMFSLVLSIPFTASAVDVYESEGDFYLHEETGAIVPYRLILPDVYDDRYVFPMVVFFHGAGERGMDNKTQLANCVQQIANKMPKAIILVPQCTGANQWVDTPWGNGSYSTDEVPESDELQAVMALIEEVKTKYSVNENTIYAAGISMGGYAVWDVMIRHNDVFAAGVAVCGAGDPSKAEILKDTPMFVFHGSADETVPVTGSTDMVQAIEAIGGTKVEYVEYDEVGHGIWGQVFSRESLYKSLQKCELSDRIVEPAEPEDTGFDLMAYLPYAGVGLGLLVVVLVLIVVLKKRKNAE